MNQQCAGQCPENLQMRMQLEISLPGLVLEGTLRNYK